MPLGPAQCTSQGHGFLLARAPSAALNRKVRAPRLHDGDVELTWGEIGYITRSWAKYASIGYQCGTLDVSASNPLVAHVKID